MNEDSRMSPAYLSLTDTNPRNKGQQGGASGFLRHGFTVFFEDLRLSDAGKAFDFKALISS